MEKTTFCSTKFLDNAVVFERFMKFSASYGAQKFITRTDTGHCHMKPMACFTLYLFKILFSTRIYA